MLTRTSALWRGNFLKPKTSGPFFQDTRSVSAKAHNSGEFSGGLTAAGSFFLFEMLLRSYKEIERRSVVSHTIFLLEQRKQRCLLFHLGLTWILHTAICVVMAWVFVIEGHNYLTPSLAAHTMGLLTMGLLQLKATELIFSVYLYIYLFYPFI